MQEARQLDQETHEALASLVRDDLRALVAHAVYLVRVYGWRHSADSTGALAAGRSAEDVVHDVLTKLVEGKLDWDPSRATLRTYLKMVIRREVGHLAESSARKREVLSPFAPERDAEAGSSPRVTRSGCPDPSAVHPVSPCELSVRQEDERMAEVRVSALLDAVSDEPDLGSVLDAILDGCDPKPRHLAVRLGMSVTDVNNLLRRLRRRAHTTSERKP